MAPKPSPSGNRTPVSRVTGGDTHYQGCRVGVGVARSCGNEPGVGIGVGVDQATSIPTLDS